MTTDLHLSLSASTPEELEHMIRHLADAFGGSKLVDAVASAHTSTDPFTGTTEAEIALKPKAKRGKKVETTIAPSNMMDEPELPFDAPAMTTAGDPLAFMDEPKAPEGDAKYDTTGGSSHDTAAGKTLSAATPEEQRTKGIEMLMEYFGRNADATGDLVKLQQRYGVKMFKEITDDKAAAFLADAHLLVNGNLDAAA